LHIAAIHDDLEVVQILLSKGAYIDCKDFQNNTPLAYARNNQSNNVKNFLKKNGAKEMYTKNYKKSF
jgi:ankyrin repeat protein